jgi:hypothetical protein
MPNKVKFTENQLSELEKMIDEGYSYKTLKNHFDQSYKVLRRIIEENDLKSKMDENVQKLKSKKVSDREKQKAVKRYKSIHQNYGDKIEKMIKEENGLLKDVAKLIGKSDGFAKAYLQYVGLDKQRKKNSDKIQKKKATKQALKNVEKGKNHPSYRDFTKKEISYYVDKVNKGWYKQKIVRHMKAKFGLSASKVNELVNNHDKKPKPYSFEGENNPMYGKSPPNKAGYGIHGHYKKNNENLIHFRSSLELKVFYELDQRSVDYKLANIRIDYKDNDGNEKTYIPDIVVSNKVYEIKPKPLTDHKQNVLKKESLVSFCENSNTHEYGGYITEDFCGTVFDIETVYDLKSRGNLIISDNQYKRLKNNL